MTRTGEPISYVIRGRQDTGLLLGREGDVGVARDGHGNFQAVRYTLNALMYRWEWQAIKVATPSEEKAWQWAREN